jgi:hypothetical protein
MRKLFAIAALPLFAGALAAQTVPVAASLLQDGGAPANGTIYWTPVLNPTTRTVYRKPGGGMATPTPVAAAVTNGAFSIAAMPDSALTTPTNLCWRVTLATTNGVQVLTNCAQPSASNYWYAAGVDNFDNFVPSIAPLPTMAYVQSINGVAGPWTFVGAGVSCDTVAHVCTFSGGGSSSSFSMYLNGAGLGSGGPVAINGAAFSSGGTFSVNGSLL